MKSKLLLLCLSLFVFVGGAKAQNWTWTGEQITVNKSYYIMNYSSREYLNANIAENGKLGTSIDDASLWTFIQEKKSFIFSWTESYFKSGKYYIDPSGKKTSATGEQNVSYNWDSDKKAYQLQEGNTGLYLSGTGAGSTLTGGTNSGSKTSNQAYWLFYSTDQKLQKDKYETKYGEVDAYITKNSDLFITDFQSKLNDLSTATYNDGTIDKLDQLMAECEAEVAAHKFELKVSAAGWATICLPYAAMIPANAQVWTAEYKGSYVTLSEYDGTVIPANQGFVVSAAQGSYLFNYSKSELTKDNAFDDIDVNDMVGVTADFNLNDADGVPYLLSMPAGKKIGFYKWSGTNGLAANKAYLLVRSNPSNPVKEFFSMGFGDVDAIQNVETSNENAAIFDVQGRQLNAVPAHGLYIKNGKKYMVK